MCFCLLMIACSKESTLESRINLDELYVNRMILTIL